MPASLIAAGALICMPLSDFASALGEKCRLEVRPKTGGGGACQPLEVAAGADLVAAISSIYLAEDAQVAAREFSALFGA